MAKDTPHQTHYTRQIHHLLAKVYGRSAVKDSLLDRAVGYFEQEEFTPSDEKKSAEESPLKLMERTERHASLLAISLTIIELAEGDSYAENNRKSAQFLGTIQLLSPTEGKRVATSNEQSKSIYKALLCLRLLDRLIIDGQMREPYINKFLTDISTEQFIDFANHDAEKYQRFVAQVKVPLVIAALLQDIGNYHPKAQTILCGAEGGLDPFRTLEIKQRKELLQINYRETIKYISEGIGIPTFVGNTKAEREQFFLDEKDKLAFIKQLLKSSVNPKNTIGNILKVPQIYTSIILSTKASYNYKLLPKVFQVLNKNAELGACAQSVVDALYKITGMFPQGFGVVYMPLGEFGDHSDCYEYAIVNRLYPTSPEQPNCRMATRQLTFIGYGQNSVIKNTSNLYFTQTAKKLATLSKERLNEILALLSSNSQERQQLDLLPRCWHANEYFSIKANQNLWNNIES
ncbi:hypothetical protein [Colwellia sp. Bg11-28]|jgi:hypothetical protein|uniref:hypothetical protein n=1 Tax=Colwellia sp. Bg11-28 TaxID=2058305 RepID=UPI000C3216A8|nr:hypothetical protein [Colwellia sp. Bg11-28]PKH88933.1 hypothetical protein CXF79_03350 [Colwellia sp. Bg11-28]